MLYERQPKAYGNTGAYYKLIKDYLGSIRTVIYASNGVVMQLEDSVSGN